MTYCEYKKNGKTCGKTITEGVPLTVIEKNGTHIHTEDDGKQVYVCAECWVEVVTGKRMKIL